MKKKSTKTSGISERILPATIAVSLLDVLLRMKPTAMGVRIGEKPKVMASPTARQTKPKVRAGMSSWDLIPVTSRV